MIVVDSSGLIAALDEADRRRDEAFAALRQGGPCLLSPFVLAECDYLLWRRFGSPEQHALLDEVTRGAYRLESFDAGDIGEAQAIMRRYEAQEIGLADASVVVIANRYECLDVLTLDERHFRVVRGPGERPFRILPADLA